MSRTLAGRDRIRARYRMNRHAIMRARTRFGIRLTTEDLRQMREEIEQKSPSVQFVHSSDGREIWAVEMGRFGHRDIRVSIVYDRSLNVIVTFRGMHRGRVEVDDAE